MPYIGQIPASRRPLEWSTAWLALLVAALAQQGLADDSRALVLPQLEASRELYTTSAAVDVRRAALREGFLKGAGLWPLPERTPLNPIRHSRREHDGYSVENVAIETLPGFWCTGNLYRPSSPSARQAAVLCPHGHFRPLGRFREEQQIRCAQLARMGATVFSYSMVGWQDSTQTTHDDPLVLALQTWNSIRAVDFVAGLDGIDPKRIAVTGASGGGSQSLYLTLVDDRIAASAPVVIVYPWSAPDGCLCEGGLPVMQAMQTNGIEFAAAAAPRPQLLISVGNDPTQDFPEVGFPFVKHIYELYGRGDDVVNVHLASEAHDYGPSKRAALYDFFVKHLGLARLAEDLSRIAIEPAEALTVFDEQHPLPSNALKGSDTIDKALRGLPRTAAPVVDARAAAIEASLFTPPGFKTEGKPATAASAGSARLKIVVRDAETNQATPCRINVVGPDGNFYQPPANDLTPYALTGQWPRAGRGNREDKAPIRYYGRFFYSRGESTVEVPPGPVRVEVWKGLEYCPRTVAVDARAGNEQMVEIDLSPPTAMDQLGYWSGDVHLHLRRSSDADDQRIFDLLDAEDIGYGAVLAFNEPAGPYAGFMESMATAQSRGLGIGSIRSRGKRQIVSGQEYRSSTYGHLNLYLRDDLVLTGVRANADDWPLYGEIGRQTQLAGGYACYAHGGYAQAIYADLVRGNINAVELLQFGVYRGIGLADWYRVLNAGFRLPCTGSSDYPACRKLGDCLTYVFHEGSPTFPQWLRAAAEGRSFVTTGPLVLLEVGDRRPGDIVRLEKDDTARLVARVRVRCEVAPVTHVQLIVGGRVAHQWQPSAEDARQHWLEFEAPVEAAASSWVAARAFSKSPLGEPDAEAHTNPIYIYRDGKAPFDTAAVDALIERIDQQIAAHEKRNFAEKAQVIAYFRQSRDRLLAISQAGGLADDEVPSLIGRSGSAEVFDPSARAHSDEQLRDFLKPLPPKSPAEALKTFDAQDGFRLQLVASEPLTGSPVAAACDEDGRLYVAELSDYPYLPKPGQKPLGAVRLLEDSDGDGVFDRSTVFADRLLWPTGIVPWKKGAFVAAAPDIWYFKDTDGDGRADVREKLFTGFGTQNPQGMLNNLVLGLDHKIYGSTSTNGGKVKPAGGGEAISVDGKDFRFDPVTLAFEATTGTVQFGNTFDDWGHRFVCSESQPLLHIVLPRHYLARNPYLPFPSAIHNLAPAPQPVFRTSPPEHWRVIRSARRIAHGERAATMPGASHHVVDAAAGVTVYRGGAYPPQYYGNVFVGDAQNNLIHRRLLEPDGATYKSLRVDEGTDFVRSSDNWFRPVNLLNAPDGTLWVLDLSREILEAIHIPLDVVKFLDLTHGRGYGRIYRLAPPGFDYPGRPRLGKASGEELVAALESPHAWHRETAHRLIYERQDGALAAPLRELLARSPSPQARVLALWSLEGLEAIKERDLQMALADAEPGVRENALQLAERRFKTSPALRERVLSMVDDGDSHVRFQLAFSLGEMDSRAAAPALATLARRHVGDSWMCAAILSSASQSSHLLLKDLLADSAFADSADGAAFVERLLEIIGARNADDEVEQALDAVAARAAKSPELARRLITAYGEGLARTGKHIATPANATGRGAALLGELLKETSRTSADANASEHSRREAIRLLGCYPLGETRVVLVSLLEARQPQGVQLAAVQALARQPNVVVAKSLLEHWPGFGPAVAEAARQAMFSRDSWTIELLRAAARGDVSLAEVDATRRDLLSRHSSSEIRDLAGQLFAAGPTVRREAVLADYQSALDVPGDVERGQKIFAQHCLACHKVGGSGYAIGPDLTSSSRHDPAALLVHILDPNRFVPPNYVQYVIVDDSGRSYNGMVAAETATSITLRRAKDEQDTLLRTTIDEMSSTGKSLMPEGFERFIDKPQMADLLSYLSSIQGAGALDIGTVGGMIEPD